MEAFQHIIEYFTNWNKLKIKIHISEMAEFYFYEREIWWASLGANIGFEQGGKHENYERPVIIIKKFNKDILWALPLTSKEKEGRYYFKTEHKGEKSFIILSQLRIISSRRLLRKIRTMPENEFLELKKRVKNFL
ncbi:MAG: type II toxin-antitoxin system PemK/MazF family toxin [bacterium]|nr:type II toxin-antitoxin system PemK/MazF family toxin [bacterium]